jgi:hypothetical protein
MAFSVATQRRHSMLLCYSLPRRPIRFLSMTSKHRHTNREFFDQKRTLFRQRVKQGGHLYRRHPKHRKRALAEAMG